MRDSRVDEYSVMVQNPDEDSVDVDEWKDFFAQFGAVTKMCLTHGTYAQNNNRSNPLQ